MFIVLEVQVNANGTVSTLVDSFADMNQAESKYHQVLAAAAVSNIPKHSAFLLIDDGFIESKSYTH